MSNKTILIVDDEQDVLDYLTAMFEDNGYEVIAATGGKEAFELARSHKPCLVTLDITMPDQTGVRTYLNLKNDPELKNIPVIIITATVTSEESLLGLLDGHAGPQGFLSKPINIKALMEMTDRLIST